MTHSGPSDFKTPNNACVVFESPSGGHNTRVSPQSDAVNGSAPIILLTIDS
jgi:hypothetical protein